MCWFHYINLLLKRQTSTYKTADNALGSTSPVNKCLPSQNVPHTLAQPIWTLSNWTCTTIRQWQNGSLSKFPKWQAQSFSKSNLFNLIIKKITKPIRWSFKVKLIGVARLDSITTSLFENDWLSWQIVSVSDDKIQITILILRRGALSRKIIWLGN